MFTCGLLKDPTVLIHHICNKFNEMNTRYLGLYARIPDEAKEMKLKHLGKIAVNLEFFHLVWAESRIPLPWTPLQNPYFNWFDHERDDQHGLARDRSSVFIPSEYYSFQNLKEPISSHNIPEHEQLGQCSIVIDSPHPDVVDSLLLTCSTICKHQSVANLCLFNLRIKNTAIDNIYKLSQNAQFLIIENCILPSNMVSCLFQQISVCSTLKGIRLHKSTFEEPGKSLIHLSDSIQNWGDNTGLEYLVIFNCSLLPDQCSSILHSLSTCKHLTYLNLSDNTVGSGGKHLAESIRNWGSKPPLTLLYLGNCGLHEDDCVELLQSLLGCSKLVEVNLSGNTIGKAAKYLVEIIRNSRHLQKFYLTNTSIPEECWGGILNSLGTSTTLTHTDLSYNALGESASDLAHSIKQWGDNPPLQELCLHYCAIPEDACCELISALFSCKYLSTLTISGSHLCDKGLHLKCYLETITLTLKTLCLDRCSIPVDVMDQIISVLSQCENLNHMSLPGNTLTGTFSQFIPHPPLGCLDLGDSALNKNDLNHLNNLFQDQKLPNLFELFLIGNSLDEMKEHLETLLDTSIKHHQRQLTIFLCHNNLFESFMETWSAKCKETDITLDFQTDLDEYNANLLK